MEALSGVSSKSDLLDVSQTPLIDGTEEKLEESVQPFGRLNSGESSPAKQERPEGVPVLNLGNSSSGQSAAVRSLKEDADGDAQRNNDAEGGKAAAAGGLENSNAEITETNNNELPNNSNRNAHSAHPVTAAGIVGGSATLKSTEHQEQPRDTAATNATTETKVVVFDGENADSNAAVPLAEEPRNSSSGSGGGSTGGDGVSNEDDGTAYDDTKLSSAKAKVEAKDDVAPIDSNVSVASNLFRSSSAGGLPANSPSKRTIKPISKTAMRLQLLRQQSFAAVIQSKWRGRIARARVKAMKLESLNEPERKSKKKDTGPEAPPSAAATAAAVSVGSEMPITSTEEAKEVIQIPFRETSRVQLVIERAIELPLSTLGSRVVVKMMEQNRTQVGNAPPPAFSCPESHYRAPRFDSCALWGTDELKPSHTVLIRVDALENPTLDVKSVGYAVLPIAVAIDADGVKKQPPMDANPQDKNIFLNSGLFYLPIHYGKIPNNGSINAHVLKYLPRIPSAFLVVRLFDPLAAVHKRLSIIPRPISCNAGNMGVLNLDKVQINQSSLAAAIIYAHPWGREERLHPLPLSSDTLQKVRSGKPLDVAEAATVYEQVAEWIRMTFPSVFIGVKGFLNPRYITQYADTVGLHLGLDMLYNMPVRKELLTVSRKAMDGQAMRMNNTKTWDSKFNSFKAIYRYLPGKSDKRDEGGHDDDGLNVAAAVAAAAAAMSGVSEAFKISASMVADDASLKLDIGRSNQRTQVFNEEMCEVKDLNLGPDSCLLLLVFSVDVITTTTPDKSFKYVSGISGRTSSSSASNAASPTSRSQTLTKSGGTEDDPSNYPLPKFASFRSNPNSSSALMREDRGKQLRGLVSINTELRDAKHCWWGLLPLQRPAPFTIGADDAHNPSDWESRETIAPYNLKSLPFNYAAPRIPNLGTHHIPLFEGFPPMQMVHAEQPYAWLLERIKQQELPTGFFTSMFSTSSRPTSAAASGSTNTDGKVSKKKLRRKSSGGKFPLNYSENVTLSKGSGAIIRVGEPRLRQLTDASMIADPTKQLDETVLMNILKAESTVVDTSAKGGKQATTIKTSRLDALYEEFQYDALKHEDEKELAQIMPQTIEHDTLVEEVNFKFINTLMSIEETEEAVSPSPPKQEK